MTVKVVLMLFSLSNVFSKGITRQLGQVEERYPGPTHPHRSPQAPPWQVEVRWGKSLYFTYVLKYVVLSPVSFVSYCHC